MKTRFPLFAIAILGFIGFADAAYLAAERFLRLPLPCSTGQGCETVITSPYSYIGPVPISFLGIVYYLAVLFLALRLITSSEFQSKLVRAVFWLTAAGFLSSVYFVYLQAAVIGAWCMYCLGSAAVATLLFVSGIALSKEP